MGRRRLLTSANGWSTYLSPRFLKVPHCTLYDPMTVRQAHLEKEPPTPLPPTLYLPTHLTLSPPKTLHHSLLFLPQTNHNGYSQSPQPTQVQQHGPMLLPLLVSLLWLSFLILLPDTTTYAWPIWATCSHSALPTHPSMGLTVR
jgi:hypothetical protein